MVPRQKVSMGVSNEMSYFNGIQDLETEEFLKERIDELEDQTHIITTPLVGHVP